MKRTVAIILASVILLTLISCTGKDAPAPYADTSQETDEAARAPDFSYDPETDFDKRFANEAYMASFVEAEDVFYWVPSCGSYLRYCAKDGGDWGVLCGKPECLHDEDNDCIVRRSCSGLIPYFSPAIGYYEGKLYVVYNDDGYNENFFAKVMRMDPDGTNKETVMIIPRLYTSDGKESKQQIFYFHRGLMFTYGTANNVDDGIPYCAICVAYMPLGGEEHTVIYEDTENTNWVYLNFAGEFAYIVTSQTDYEEVHKTRIMRYSIVTKELETIYFAEGADNSLNGRYWVTEEGDFYTLGQYEEGKGVKELLKLEDGELKPVWRLEGEEEGYNCIGISDGIVIARNYEEFSRSGMSTDIDLLVKRFDGTVLYKGKLPVGWLSEALQGAVLEYIDKAVGNENELLFQFHLSERNAKHANERQTYIVVKYDLSDGGIRETLLGISHEQAISDWLSSQRD